VFEVASARTVASGSAASGLEREHDHLTRLREYRERHVSFARANAVNAAVPRLYVASTAALAGSSASASTRGDRKHRHRAGRKSR